MFYAGKKAIRILSDMTEESTDYVEQVNLFNVSFGKGIEGLNQYYEKAIDFQDELERKLSTNIAESMHYQSTFNSIAKSIGLGAENAYLLSESLTKVGYDLSSLYNTDPSKAMQKLQSGVLTGQSRPLRDFGIDVTQATLQTDLDILGIDRKISSLSQAEKVVLRYISTLRQAQIAQGDFANTMESPANQLRIFDAQVTSFKRNMGNLWQGFLGGILPYINGILMVVNELLKMTAKLFGFQVFEQGVNVGASLGVDDLSDSLGSSVEKAKELKAQLMGFDEINNITLQDSSSSGSGSGAGVGGIDQRLLDAMEDYDNLMDRAKNKAADIRDKMLEWLGFHRTDAGGWELNSGLTNLEKMLDVAKGIGVAILGWKVSSTIAKLLSSLGIVSEKGSMQFATGFTLTITGAWFLWNGTKHLMNGDWDLFTILETMFGVGATSLGIASMIKATALGKSITWSKALVIGLGISFVIQGWEVFTNGLKEGDLKKEIIGALGFGAGISMAIIPNLNTIKTIFKGLATKITSAFAIGVNGAKSFGSALLNLGTKAIGTTAGIAGLTFSIGNAYKNMKNFNDGSQTAGKTMGNLAVNVGVATASGALLGSVLPGIGTGLGALVGATGATVASFIGMKSATQDCTEQLEQLDKITEEFDATYNEYVQSHIDANKALENSYGSKMTEIKYAEDLKKKLDDLVDSNGHIIEGYENRADVILGELGQALGIELGRNGNLITKNGEVIKSYGELSNSIQEIIKQKKQEAKIEVLTEKYKEALRFQLDYTEKRKELQEKLNRAIETENEMREKNASAEQLEKAREKTHALAEELLEFDSQMKNSIDTINSYEYDMIAVQNEFTEETMNQYDKILEKAKETKGGELTVQEENNAKMLALAKTNMEEFLKIYDTQDEKVQAHMLSIGTTIDTYSPKLSNKWKELATKSVNTFTEELSKIEPDIQAQVLKDVTITNGMSSELAAAWANLAKSSKEEFEKTINEVDDSTKGAILSSITSIFGCKQEYIESWIALANNGSEEYNKALSRLPEDTREQINNIVLEAKNGITPFESIMSNASKNAMNLFNTGFMSKQRDIFNTATNLASGVQSRLGINTYGIGVNIGLGVQQGLLSTMSNINNAVTSITNSVLKTFKGNLVIKSPSRKMRSLAKNVPLGIALGIDDESDSVYTSMDRLTDAMTINTDDLKIDIKDIADFSQINRRIQSESNVNVNSNLSQQLSEGIARGFRNAKIVSKIEAKIEKGVLLKEIQTEAEEYEMQTGQPAFDF